MVYYKDARNAEDKSFVTQMKDWLSNPWVIGGIVLVIAIIIFYFFIWPGLNKDGYSDTKYMYY